MSKHNWDSVKDDCHWFNPDKSWSLDHIKYQIFLNKYMNISVLYNNMK